MLVGGVVALLGLIRLVMAFTGKRPVYGPTGETLTRKELFFEAQDRQALLAAFQAGDMEKIERIPHGHSSNVLLMIYTTPSGFLHTGSGAGVRTARIRRRDRCGAVFAGCR